MDDVKYQEGREKEGSEEIKDWLMQLHATMDKDPPHALFTILRGSNRKEDLTVPVVNNGKRFVRIVFPEGRYAVAASPETKLDKMALYLYYRLLYGIVEALMHRRESKLRLVDDMSEMKMQRLKNSHFHNAVLCCSAEIVAHAFLGKSFPWATLIADRMLFCVDVWMVALYVRESNGFLQLPMSLVEFLIELQRSILLEHCFGDRSMVYTYLLEGGGCLYMPGETCMTERLLLDFAYLMLDITGHIAEVIVTKMETTRCSVDGFVDQCQDLVDRVVYGHLIYCVGKLFGTQLTFKQLTRECTLHLPSIQLPSFGHVLITNPAHEVNNGTFGTIWRFYNETFLVDCQGEIDEIKQELARQAVPWRRVH